MVVRERSTTVGHAPPFESAASHPVVDLIRRRVVDGSVAGARDDPHILALTVEGGGMRGVASAGMVLALEQLGMTAAFDRVYGSSAGSMMGAYFVAGQATLGASMYYQDLANRRFISRRRFLSLGRRPVLDLDFLIDEVIESVKPLDYGAVIESPIELHVLATSLRSGAVLDITDFRRREELREAMRASARLPGLAGPPVWIDGQPCYDGGLTDSLAYTAALKGGASHVLALRSRPPGALPESLPRWQESLMRTVLRVEPEAVQLSLDRPARYHQETVELERLLGLGAADSPQVLAVGPRADDPVISRLSRTRSELETGTRVGIRALYRALGLPEPQIFELLRPGSRQWKAE
jgi:predicted patatin/cPLA2 family phospholipase